MKLKVFLGLVNNDFSWFEEIIWKIDLIFFYIVVYYYKFNIV